MGSGYAGNEGPESSCDTFPSASRYAQQLLDRYNTNGDDKLDLKDEVFAPSRRSFMVGCESNIESELRAFDANKDGFVDKLELSKGAAKYFDKNHNGKIDQPGLVGTLMFRGDETAIIKGWEHSEEFCD